MKHVQASKSKYAGRPFPKGKYAPFPAHLSLNQVKAISTATRVRDLSLIEIENLSLLLNQALTMFLRGQASKKTRPSKAVLERNYNEFYRAMKRLEQTLPEERSALFWAVSDMSEQHAMKFGLPPELPPFDSEGDIDHLWYMKRSFERLRHLFREIRRVSKSLRRRGQPANPGVRPGPSVRLIGADLPEIFEYAFKRRYGKSRTGPGVRFVQSVLEAANIGTEKTKPFSTETILHYRLRALKVYSSAKKSAVE
jgi:hypothetical protein